MRCLFTDRRSIFAAGIKAREGGTSSHCAVDLGDVIVDATFLHGVRAWTRAEFFAMHTLVNAYQMHLPATAVGEGWARARAAEGLRYDWLRILGYMLWRTLGSKRGLSCEELQLGALLLAGMQFATGTKRPGVRMLHEACAQRGRDITHEYQPNT